MTWDEIVLDYTKKILHASRKQNSLPENSNFASIVAQQYLYIGQPPGSNCIQTFAI